MTAVARLDHGPDVLFHTPGYVAVAARAVADAFERHPDDPRWRDVAAELADHAATAERQWRDLHTRPFAPTCLTLYLNGECNLRCTYCFSDPGRGPGPRLTGEAVSAAARLVARSCRDRRTPMTVALHGGGEPVLHADQVEDLLGRVEEVAAAAALPLFRYVATNGVMPAAKARWLAGRVDLVGLSCDGPPDLQDAHRPTWGGQASSRFVERTAHILREAGTPFHVRVTITPESAARQEEIAAYLCGLGPAEIHVEPVYRLGRAFGDQPLGADEFAAHFLAARDVAHAHGVAWVTSGSRPGEVHGPYCHVLRDVLQLVPGDVAPTCFALPDAAAARRAGLVIGWYNAGEFRLDGAAISRQRATLAAVPLLCADCFSRMHCAGACPEGCPLTGRAAPDANRCALNRAVAEATIRRAAAQLRHHDLAPVVGGVVGATRATRSLSTTTRRS